MNSKGKLPISDRFLPVNKKWIFASAAVAIDGAIFDLMTPFGVASGVIYVIFILTAFWWRSPYTPFLFAVIASTLTAIGYLSAIGSQSDQEITLLNRALSVLLIWLVAAIVYHQKKTETTLQRSEETLRAIQDGTVDGIISINIRGTVESYSRACETIFGYTADEVIGKNVKMLMPDPYQAEHDGYLSNFRKTGDKKIIGIGREVRGMRKDGSTLPIDLSVSEVNASGERVFCGIVRDITERKQAEEDREQFIEQLAHSNRELDNFAYVASHDLKAPLRVIGNTSQWLEEDLGPDLSEDSRENMALLRNRVKRMERLLDDLLDYSRIGRTNEKAGAIRISGKEVLNDAMLLADIPEGFCVTVSPVFSEIQLEIMPLKQIFANLINNAIKHHDKTTGNIDIGVTTQEGKYVFTVADDGPGIAPEFHDQVFKMFKTLKPRDQVEGSGMGLAMIEKHIHHFGEEISLASDLGQGCTFRFTWPKAQEPAVQDASPPVSEEDQYQRKQA